MGAGQERDDSVGDTQGQVGEGVGQRGFEGARSPVERAVAPSVTIAAKLFRPWTCAEAVPMRTSAPVDKPMAPMRAGSTSR